MDSNSLRRGGATPTNTAGAVAASWAEPVAVRERMQAGGLHTTSPPWWPDWRWWRNPQASNFVGNEVLKLGYYVVRYRFGI